MLLVMCERPGFKVQGWLIFLSVCLSGRVSTRTGIVTQYNR